MFSDERDSLRRFYLDTWNRHKNHLPLEPLQALVADVINEHPEYHALLETGDEALGKDFEPEMGQTNPFLHMGMHITIREQVSTARPAGICDCYRKITAAHGSVHEADHNMMECLGEILYAAQSSGQAPDDQAYLECLEKLS